MTNLPEPKRLLRFLGCLPAVRKALLGRLTADSCIETGRLVHLLLREWRLPSRLVPVEVRIANARAFALIRRGEFAAGQHGKDGAYVITVGEPMRSPPGRWAGHLAVACGNVLIDPSLDQANRLDFGIRFEAPWVLRIDAAFWADGGIAGTFDSAGTRVEYIHHPSNQGFLRTPAWRKAPILLPVARRALRGALAGAADRVHDAAATDA